MANYKVACTLLHVRQLRTKVLHRYDMSFGTTFLHKGNGASTTNLILQELLHFQIIITALLLIS